MRQWWYLGAWLAAVSVVSCADFLTGGGVACDFKSFYCAAQVAREGGNIYDVSELYGAALRDGIPGGVFPYLYPPVVAHVMAPLSRITPVLAQTLWSLGALAAAASAITVSLAVFGARAPRDAPRPGIKTLFFAALMLWLVPLENNIELGQINAFVLCLLVVALACYFSGREIGCGVFLALATVIKITPAVFVLFLLVRRRRRALVAWGAALLLVFVATLPFGVLAAWATFARVLPTLSPGAHIPGLFGPEALCNFSYAGLFARLAPGPPLGVEVLATAATLASVVPAIVCAKKAHDEASERLAASLFFPAMMLTSPLVYVHHVLYMAPMLIACLTRAESRGQYRVIAGLLAASIVAAADLPPLYQRLPLFERLGPATSSLNLIALLALYALGVAMARVDGDELFFADQKSSM